MSEPDEWLSEALDKVLSAVAMMRTKHYSFEGGPNPRIPLFVGFAESILDIDTRSHGYELIFR